MHKSLLPPVGLPVKAVLPRDQRELVTPILHLPLGELAVEQTVERALLSRVASSIHLGLND